MNVVAVAKPKFFVRADSQKSPTTRNKLRTRDVKQAIQHAQLVCYNFEDTSACRVAWDRVDEISHALARQQERELWKKNIDEICLEDATACKEYDV
jgi:hypothetical protein